SVLPVPSTVFAQRVLGVGETSAIFPSRKTTFDFSLTRSPSKTRTFATVVHAASTGSGAAEATVGGEATGSGAQATTTSEAKRDAYFMTKAADHSGKPAWRPRSLARLLHRHGAQGFHRGAHVRGEAFRLLLRNPALKSHLESGHAGFRREA